MDKNRPARRRNRAMRARQKAHIFVHSADGVLAVAPGTFIAYRTDAPHLLRNLTGTRLDITFPGTNIGPFTVAANGTVPLLGLSSLNAGVYTYEVAPRLGKRLHLVAIGNSPPRVIVDP